MSGGVAQVEQAAFGEHDDRLAVDEAELVDLRLDVDALDVGLLVEPGHVDLVVEVADVADDRPLLHAAHHLGGDDVLVAGGGDEDVEFREDPLDRRDLVTVHRCLEGADGVDLGDDDSGALAAQCFGGTLADVAVAEDQADLAADHDVGATVDAVEEAVSGAVLVVELRLGDGVVDVDARELEDAVSHHLVEAVHAGGGLFGHAADVGGHAGEDGGVFALHLADQFEDDAVLFGIVLFVELGDGTLDLELGTLVHEESGVATVVEDQVAELFGVGPAQGLLGAPPVLVEGLALPGEDRDTLWVVDGAVGTDDGSGCCLVLGREDVAGDPADVGAERGERLDQHGGLDGHVQAAHDAGALERLLVGVLGTQGHETRHFVLGEFDLFAADAGEIDVGDLVVTVEQGARTVVRGVHISSGRCGRAFTRETPRRKAEAHWPVQNSPDVSPEGSCEAALWLWVQSASRPVL